MKILVTGGTGFIGTHLVRRLAITDHQVTCLVRKNSDTSALENLGLNFVNGDITDSESLHPAFKDQDCVINLANIYSFWEVDPGVYRRVNIEGTRKEILEHTYIRARYEITLKVVVFAYRPQNNSEHYRCSRKTKLTADIHNRS